MSILIIQLPARARLQADADQAEAGTPSPLASSEYAYVLSGDGVLVGRQGRSVPAMLPSADTVVAVMAPQDTSWHRLILPKAPPARLRAALAGMLEEALLDDPDSLHLAVAPMARAGQPTWVAACDRAWLNKHLQTLEQAKVRVARVVPGVWPDEPATGYFQGAPSAGGEAEGGADPGQVMLTWSTPEGVASWPLGGSLSRALLPEPLPPQARFFATAGVAAEAERWLGHAVPVQSASAQLLLAARSVWNILQFELTPRSKGLNTLSDEWRRFMSPSWRPVRAGLVALVAVQVLGLNLWAWHERSQLKALKAEVVQVLRQTHPQVQVVLNAPAQMQKETELLRAAAGQPGDNDLEALMGAVASAWPPDKPSAGLQYDGSSLVLVPPAGWGPSEQEALRSKLAAAGVQASFVDGRLSVSRAPHG